MIMQILLLFNTLPEMNSIGLISLYKTLAGWDLTEYVCDGALPDRNR